MSVILFIINMTNCSHKLKRLNKFLMLTIKQNLSKNNRSITQNQHQIKIKFQF